VVLPATYEKVNIVPSVMKTILSTYAIPDVYELAVKVKVRVQAPPGVIAVGVAGATQLIVGAVVSFIPLR
jgi:hypothetical protein